MRKIIIGTRGSDLALWQARHVQSILAEHGIGTEIKIIVTKGDITHHLSFDKIEGKGFFTKELEEELIAGSIDLAVHSYKDLPTQSPEGLIIAAFSSRELATDAILIRPDAFLDGEWLSIKSGAKVGTSSARRKMQIKALRPDLSMVDLRGNVPTRVNKLREGQYDAIVLASAGLIRLELDLSGLEVVHLPPSVFVPAASQGVLALQTRESDSELIVALQEMQDNVTKTATQTERLLLHHFVGGCHMPLAIHAKLNPDETMDLRIAQANHPDDFPKRLHWPSLRFNEQNLTKLPQLVNSWNPQPFFISRNSEEAPFFYRFAQQFHLNSSFTSMNQIQSVAFHLNDRNFEAIVFNSERAVSYFFEHESAENFLETLIVSSGEATTRALERKGLKVDYTCKKSDFSTISEQLKSLLSGKNCLIPCSAQSARTLAISLSEIADVTEIITYKAEFCSQQIPAYKWYVFTSPSQVDAFAKINKFPAYAHYLCLGPTTASSLSKHGLSNIHVSAETTELSLLELLNTLQLHDFEREIR